MGKLRRFWASPRQFKWLLVEAGVRLSAASASRYLPLSRGTRSLLKGLPIAARTRAIAPTSEDICRAVETASRYIPGTSCLVKAQACHAMLNRCGYPAEIRVGVLKGSSELQSHAWVECEGTTIMGKNGVPYVELELPSSALQFEPK